MKILVLGATGMAGHTIAIYLSEAGHEVVGFSRTKINYCENINGDITDFDNTKKIITEGNFDAIINAIGILNEDAERHKAEAVLVNSYLPHFLSETTKNMRTKIIQMSTDCVFSGKSGSYTESSLKDGELFYDKTKALGELDNDIDLTFRNSIIGPDMNEKGIGLFNWFMKQKGQINGFDKAIWTGVTTLTLAKAIQQALIEDLCGIYNLVNNKTITKYELLRLLSKHCKENQLEIRPTACLVLDKSLINTRKDFSFIVPSYETMIIEMKDWIDKHRTLYPHYYI